MGQKQLQRWHLMKMVEVGKITLKEREEKMNVSCRKLAGDFRVGLLSDLISSPGIKSKRYLKAQTEAPQSHQRIRAIRSRHKPIWANDMRRIARVRRCGAPTSICAKTAEWLFIWVGMIMTEPPHDYPHQPGNCFGDVLTRRLNRLPLPHLSPLDDMAQAWEREVKGKHQSFLCRCPVEKPAPGGHDLLGSKFDGRIPVWLLHVDGMEHRI
jgi:hypothetical protein